MSDSIASSGDDILAALDNPDLFGPFFQDGSWHAWRAFLAALFALPMSEAEAATFRTCTGRTALPQAPFAEAALIVGRRGGKSRQLALIATYLATFRNYAPYLAPGEVATVAVLAQTQRQARTIFRYISGLLKAVPALAPMIADETNDVIELKNRVVIEISAASFRATRGYSYAAILCDEIAFWRNEETSANPDIEILRALRPGMASIPGAILLLASSPYAKKGSLYSAFRRHFGKDDARVLVWKAPTATMNPKVDPAIIAEAYEEDPESAKAEYGGEFRDDLADFIAREVVDAVTCIGRHELPPEPGVAYAGFCDPSGGSSNSMTLAIGHARDDVCVLDAVLEVRAPFNPDDAVAACAALAKRFGVSRLTGDRYAGLWPVAAFAKHGITFVQSARPKSDIYRDLLPIATAQRLELLEHPRLAAQLVGLERRTARGGRDSVDHGPGAHDYDVANAVAGVLVEVDQDRRPSLIPAGSLLAEDGAPVPLPSVCDKLVAVVAADAAGQVAVTFWARSQHHGIPLTLLDFSVGPLSAGLFDGVMTTLTEHAALGRPRAPAMVFTTSEPLTRLAAQRGLQFRTVPPGLIADPARLALAAAGHALAGKVKIALPAFQRAEASPLRGQLDLRGGDAADASPLRLSLLTAISLALDDRRQAAAV